MIRLRQIALIAAAAAGLLRAQAPILSLAATTANVSGANDSIRIDVLRWSTDAERDQLLAAWSLRAPAATAGGRGGRGGRAGRGPAADPAPDPSAVDGNDPVAGVVAAGGRAGRAGRGGRGGRGGDSGPAPTPESSLKTALGSVPIVGHLWSSEVAGYSLRSATRIAQPDGTERILLITDRRLGGWNELWKAAGTDAATTYEFSVIELRLNSKGEGEGKVSLTGKVTADSASKVIALENYGAEPVVLKNVRRK